MIYKKIVSYLIILKLSGIISVASAMYSPPTFDRMFQPKVASNYYVLIGIPNIEQIIQEAEKAVKDNEDFKKLSADSKRIDDEISPYKNTLEEFDITKLKEELASLEKSPVETSRSVFLKFRIKQLKEWGRVKVWQQRQAMQELIDPLSAQRKKVVKAKSEKAQEIFSGVLNRSISSRTITERCQTVRKALLKRRTELKRDLEQERISWEEKREKNKELLQIKYDLEQTAHACPILLDDKKRADYNKDLTPSTEDVEGLIDAVQRGVAQAKSDPPDQWVLINDLAGKFLVENFKPMLQEMFGDIPEAAAKIFNQNIALRSIDFLPKPAGEDVRYWVGFSGLMALNTFEVRASVYLVKDIYGLTHMSFSVELPTYYKLSDLIPGFTLLDRFSFPKAKLIFSNFSYYDIVFIRKGLTFVAEVDLSGPLQIFHDLKEKSKYFKSLVFENEPVLVSGYLPHDLVTNYLDTRFELVVPFHFGFDLRKISFIPKSVSQVVQQITSDDFRLTIMSRFAGMPLSEKVEEEGGPRTLKQTEDVRKTVTGLFDKPSMVWGRFMIEGEAGARILLGTQPDPLLLTLLIHVQPSPTLARTYLSAALNLKRMLELKWLALGDATIQLEWDTALIEVAAAVGLPFTGFGLQGRIDLGKPGASRASLSAVGGFQVSTTDVPGLLFNLKGKNIRFADMLSYASYLAAKAKILKVPIPVEKIPTLTFHAVEGYASLSTMRIGHQLYPAGLGLHVETELFDKKMGFKVDMSNEFRLSGFGYMPRVDFRIKNRDIFKLYDSLHTGQGPQLLFAFDPKDPLAGYFNVRGIFEVPALRLKQDVQFQWSGWTLDADWEGSIAGITVMLGARLNTKPMGKAVEEVKAFPGELKAPPKEESKAPPKEDANEEIVKGFPGRLTQLKEMEPKWKEMYIKFGFKQDFAEFMTKIAKNFLEKMKTASSRKLKAAAEQLRRLKEQGARGFDAEVERMQRSIAKTEQNVQKAKERCAQARWYKKFVCAQVAGQQATLAAKKGYLNALVKPTKAVATTAAQLSASTVLKIAAIQEFALESAITGLELIQAGLTIFSIKEAFGEYSSQDIAELKLPKIRRFVAEVRLIGDPITISLYNIQFDFKKPGESIANLTRQVMSSVLGKKMGYIEMIGVM